MSFGRFECAFGRKLAGINLINSGFFAPFGMLELDIRRGLVRIHEALYIRFRRQFFEYLARKMKGIAVGLSFLSFFSFDPVAG